VRSGVGERDRLRPREGGGFQFWEGYEDPLFRRSKRVFRLISRALMDVEWPVYPAGMSLLSMWGWNKLPVSCWGEAKSPLKVCLHQNFTKTKNSKTKIPFPTKDFALKSERHQRQCKHDSGSSISYSRDPGLGIAQLRTICFACIYLFHAFLRGEGLEHERDKRNTQIIVLASKTCCTDYITFSRMIVRTNILSTFNFLLQQVHAEARLFKTMSSSD
jgi:hypothetical protein